MDLKIFDNLTISEKKDIIKYLKQQIELEIEIKKFNSDKKSFEEFISLNSKHAKS